MGPESHICQNCKQPFMIEPDDFLFYEKIQVPPPTWCPDCRLIRRLSFMNERAFHWRECDLCREKTLAIYPPEYSSPVYCQHCWWSDKWDPMAYGKEVDFKRPFITQFNELIRAVPAISLSNIRTTLENSEFVNQCSYLKNCYLLFQSDYNDECAYSTYLEKSKRCLDIYGGHLCELAYFSSNLYKDFKAFYSSYCNECVNVWFSKNLNGCSDCFGCINLRNKRYCIFNEQYSKEDYFAKLKEFRTGSHKFVEEMKNKVRKVQLGFPRKFMEGLQHVGCTGDCIFNSKNAKDCYDVGGTQDVRYCQFLFVDEAKNAYDSYDYTMWGANSIRMYECMGCGNNQSDIKFSHICWNSAARMQYCWYILVHCEDLLGCAALKDKKYCILNKQYSRGEYEALLPKVIKHMNTMPYVDPRGIEYRYGEFLPPGFSTCAYNDSVAQKYFPKDKEAALASGYTWRDQDPKQYTIILKASDLPDDIADTEDTILQETVGCEHEGKCLEQCTIGFRLTKSELEFYRAMNLPLPRKCHNCRHYEILSWRNPIKFYERACMCGGRGSRTYENLAVHFHGDETCPNAFKTSYAPDRQEIIYCEQCYQAEIS